MKKSQANTINRAVFFVCRLSFNADDGTFNFEEWDRPPAECLNMQSDNICEVDDRPCDCCAFVFRDATEAEVKAATQRWRRKEERRKNQNQVHTWS